MVKYHNKLSYNPGILGVVNVALNRLKLIPQTFPQTQIKTWNSQSTSIHYDILA